MTPATRTLGCAAVAIWLSSVSATKGDSFLVDELSGLVASLPAEATDYSPQAAARLASAARILETRFEAETELHSLAKNPAVVRRVLALVDTKHEVDRLLQSAIGQRGEFAQLDPTQQTERARAFLQITSQLIDLSGRLRYLLFDRLNAAAVHCGRDTQSIRQLLAGLSQRQSSIGAVVLARRFLIPVGQQPTGGARLSATDVLSLLRLIGKSGETELLPIVSNFAFDDAAPPELVLAAIETIRQLGLPQEPLAGQAPFATLPEPTVLADELFDRLQSLPTLRLNSAARRQRVKLFRWLEICIRQGETGASYRWGSCDVQPGDWFLMRNPSPYNLFTDLSPGLFTHVGVVTDYRDSDGIRRFVLVDLPERGTKMQATNFDIFVQRTLHYVVLRHHDPAVSTAMAAAARAMIGNSTQFDMNFRTDRIEHLRGQPLAGKKIHTYCAGLLLLCAMQSTAPRSDFFPLAEHPAGGNTVENLAQLGLTFGNNFVSPTGAIFSSRMDFVGSRKSMYDPRREIQEAIFNHFAKQLVDRKLTPAPDLYQSMRQKMAEAARTNPLLAQAMASAAQVSTEVDLVAAAKAIAVVETLDQFAYDARDGFSGALMAIRAGGASALRARGFDDASLEAIRAYRSRHDEICRRWDERKISPRELRILLVDYYIQMGRTRMDARFFIGPK